MTQPVIIDAELRSEIWNALASKFLDHHAELKELTSVTTTAVTLYQIRYQFLLSLIEAEGNPYFRGVSDDALISQANAINSLWRDLSQETFVSGGTDYLRKVLSRILMSLPYRYNEVFAAVADCIRISYNIQEGGDFAKDDIIDRLIRYPETIAIMALGSL